MRAIDLNVYYSPVNVRVDSKTMNTVLISTSFARIINNSADMQLL